MTRPMLSIVLGLSIAALGAGRAPAASGRPEAELCRIIKAGVHASPGAFAEIKGKAMAADTWEPSIPPDATHNTRCIVIVSSGMPTLTCKIEGTNILDLDDPISDCLAGWRGTGTTREHEARMTYRRLPSRTAVLVSDSDEGTFLTVYETPDR